MTFKKVFLFFVVLGILLFMISVSYAADGCCVKVKDSFEYCVEESELSGKTCEPDKLFPKKCSDVDVCANKGCCFVDSVCTEGVPQVRCTGSFNSGTCEHHPSCTPVCCQSTDTGFHRFVSQSDCSSLGTIQEEITNGQDCAALNLGTEADVGCCIREDKTCTYGISSVCESGNHQKGYYCSDLKEQCTPQCIKHHHKEFGNNESGLDRNKIYWYDSCGNHEEVVDDCNLDAAKAVGVNTDGSLSCVDTTCKHVWDNPSTDENHDGILTNDNTFSFLGASSRSYRYNGESWCEYMQAKVGPGLDIPGTRHYVHFCDRGNETVILQGEGRNQICVEKIVTKEKKDPAGAVVATYVVTEASWIDNTEPENCFKCNDQEIVDKKNSIDCCQAYKNCVYIYKRAVNKDNSLELQLSKDDKIKLDGALSKVNEFLKLRYWQGGDLKYEYNFRDVVEVSECKEEPCKIYLKNPPAGNYRITVYGKGCGGPFNAICDTKEIEMLSSIVLTANKGGELITEKGVRPGFCVPLVPPSGTEHCGKVEKYGLDKIDPNIDFNYYYELPYNSYVLSGNCKGPECTRTLGTYEFNSQKTDVQSFIALLDNSNSVCRAFGDCGYVPNLLGTGDYNFTGLFKFVATGSVPLCSVLGTNGCASSEEVSESYIKNYKDNEANKFNELHNGSPMRPEDFGTTANPIFFLFPFSLLRKKFRKLKFKSFYFLLILLLFLLAACDDDSGSVGRMSEDNVTVQCKPWSPSFELAPCEKCNLNWSNGGLLPNVSLLAPDGKPFYKCTRELCSSIGRLDVQCDFVSTTDTSGSDETGVCVRHTEFAKPRVQFLGATYTCSSLKSEGCESGKAEIHNDAGNQKLEIKGNIEENTPITFSFKTIGVGGSAEGNDFPSFCFYATKEDMSDQKAITNDEFGITHTLSFLGKGSNTPTTPVYNFWIVCQRPTNDAHELQPEKAQVSFTVAQGPDLAAPYLEFASGTNYVKFGETTKEVSFHVRGDVSTCKWDNESVAYKNMNLSDVSQEFGCSPVGPELLRSFTCTATVSGINLGEHKFWFSCLGTNGKASEITPKDGLSIIGTKELNITNIKCLHQGGERCTDTIYENNFTFSIDTIGGAEDGKAGCKWAPEKYSFDCFLEPGCKDALSGESNYATHHQYKEYKHVTGLVALKFRCADVIGNIAEANITVHLEKDETAPKITKFYRSGSDLMLETNELSNCYFTTNRTGVLNTDFRLESGDGLEHHTPITGDFFRINCEDRFNNKNEEIIIYISK